MPEVPEIETLRRDLDREVGGKRIKSVEVPGSGTIPRHASKKQFITALEGTKINQVIRRDLLLVAKLDSGDALVIDMSSGGHLRRHANKDAVEKTTKVVIGFTQGGQLRAIDEKSNLEMFVTPFDTITETVPALATLGLDILGSEPVSWTSFGERMLQHRSVKLRNLLLDRSVVAGIGPMYADEILHAAGLRPDREVASLSTQEIRRFFRAVVETLHESAKHRGVTGSDGEYLDLAGNPGGWTEGQVYERDGKACLRCRGVISKIRMSNKPVYLCTDCQV